jgi:hypothetical protein
VNQILTQKWFLLQNTKDSSLNHNGVFNNGEWTYSSFACLVELQQKFPNLFEAGICNPQYIRASRTFESLDLEIHFKIQTSFDLSNC